MQRSLASYELLSGLGSLVTQAGLRSIPSPAVYSSQGNIEHRKNGNAGEQRDDPGDSIRLKTWEQARDGLNYGAENNRGEATLRFEALTYEAVEKAVGIKIRVSYPITVNITKGVSDNLGARDHQ